MAAKSSSEKAAEQGHANAQFWYGHSFYEGHYVVQNEEEAVRWLHKASMQKQTLKILKSGFKYIS